MCGAQFYNRQIKGEILKPNTKYVLLDVWTLVEGRKLAN